MANWRPVDVRLWNDRKFLACSDGARLLWLFLLTCPSLPIPGVVLGGDAALSEMLGWEPERLRERFQELARNGLQVRREARIVWLRNALKYQPPANPNMVKSWGKKWDDVPEGDLKLELWEALRIACKSWSVLFAKMFAKPLSDGSGNRYGNRSENGFAHEHQHEHQHQHQHDPEKNLPPARDPAVPSQEPPTGPPAPDRGPGDASTAPSQSDRASARAELRAELEAARSRAASERGVRVQPLLAFDRGIDRDLTDQLAACPTKAALAMVVSQARHAIAMAELEVTHGGKSFEWFTGAIFTGGNFARLVGMTPEDARKPRERIARPGRDGPTGRVEPKEPHEYPEGRVHF